MKSEEKIKAIYENIANKELNVWCKIIGGKLWSNKKYVMTYIFPHNKYWMLDVAHCYAIYYNDWKKTIEDSVFIFEIIWHPVFLWDILDYIEENNLLQYWCDIFWEIIEKWWERRKSIDEQSELCIDFIYDLIKE